MTDSRTPGGASGPAEFARPEKPGDLTPFLKHLLGGGTLSAEQTTAAFEAMMTGQSHDAEMGALLALLATRTPTADEILGAARVMRKHVDAVESNVDRTELVDTAGTGGAPKTFNVSTAAAIIAAACGAKVAKHGNRSRTGRGSAEVLGQIGVNVDADRATQARCLDEAGVCFCFAIHHHPATKNVMPVRLALGVPTIFNLLGPLTNPAGARRQLMGVYEERFLQPIAEAHAALGTIRALIVHSADGLDEISISAPTQMRLVDAGEVRVRTIDPTEHGIESAPIESLQARDLEHAAAMIRGVLDGTEQGPPRDMTLINAAATLYVAGKVTSIDQGMELAQAAITDGAAMAKLEQLIELSRGSA